MRFGRPATQRPAWLRYGAAVVLTCLVVAGRVALDPVWGHRHNRHLVFIPMVLVAAWLGGLGPGVVSAVLSTAALGVLLDGRRARVGRGDRRRAGAVLRHRRRALRDGRVAAPRARARRGRRAFARTGDGDRRPRPAQSAGRHRDERRGAAAAGRPTTQDRRHVERILQRGRRGWTG